MPRIFLFLFTALLAGSFALAKEDVSYPIAELGSCENEEACRAYCEVKEHIVACANYGEQMGLLSSREADQARKFAAIGAGPGNCASEASCAAYCEDIGRMDECLDFAERHGLISGNELREARAVSRAMASGKSLPGGCKNKAACEAYCNDPSHIDECLSFAEAAGFLSEAELAEAKQFAKAVATGARPPGNCRGKEQCEAYCNDSAHMEECVEFALAAGFIPPEEADMVRKILPLMKAGKMPGGCRSKESCEAYCADESHMAECAEFAIAAGFMKPEEAAIMQRVLPLMKAGRTPGGCRSKEQCEAYCANEAHAEECMNFAIDAGFMSPEDVARRREGPQEQQEH